MVNNFGLSFKFVTNIDILIEIMNCYTKNII